MQFVNIHVSLNHEVIITSQNESSYLATDAVLEPPEGHYYVIQPVRDLAIFLQDNPLNLVDKPLERVCVQIRNLDRFTRKLQSGELVGVAILLPLFKVEKANGKQKASGI